MTLRLFSTKEEILPQDNETGDFSGENAILRQDRLLESMELLPNEIIMCLSQEMDTMDQSTYTQSAKRFKEGPLGS